MHATIAPVPDPSTDPTPAADPARKVAAALLQALGGAVTPLAGGYSGETFRAVLDGEDVVLRVYGRQPERAAVDIGLLRRLRGVVPVPAVLDAVLDTGPLPPYVITQWLPGERLDVVLDAVSPVAGRELGRSVGGVLLRLGTVRFDRPGALVSVTLTTGALPDGAGSLEDWVRAHLDRGALRTWSADDRTALLATARAVRPLLDAVAGERTLVHGDLNPKNLLVDPDRSEVTGLLDWEFAWSGCWLADLGNLLRLPPEDDDDTGSAFLEGVLELLSDAGRLTAGWLDTARALDLFALVELAARTQTNPVVERARDLLQATARTGSLAAGRPVLPAPDAFPSRA
jgi:Ser/Thr protein kinase RdoA (MazF antagonist)